MIKYCSKYNKHAFEKKLFQKPREDPLLYVCLQMMLIRFVVEFYQVKQIFIRFN
jgi:hypothetical protein